MLCFHCGKFGHDIGGCPVKQQAQAATTSNGDSSNETHRMHETREHETSMFGPWMKPKRRNNNANKSAVTLKPTAPTIPTGQTSNVEHSGSIFAILVDHEQANDSDEIIPESAPSPKAETTGKDHQPVNLRNKDRAQLKEGLQARVSLANKSVTKKGPVETSQVKSKGKSTSDKST